MIKILLSICATLGLVVPTIAQPASVDFADTWSGLPKTAKAAGETGTINDMTELAPGLVLAFDRGHTFIYDLFAGEATASVPLKDSIPGWPAAWSGGLTACTEWDSTSSVLFRDSMVVWMDLSPLQVRGTPEPFAGLPKQWKGKVDAALRWDEGQVYLFSGSEFMIWNLNDDTVSEAFALETLVGWPKGWSSFDAVINLGGMVHFIRGQEVLVYDQSLGAFADGYPHAIVNR